MSSTGSQVSSSSGSGRRFILKRLVGAGAFGEVYLAEQDSGAGFTRPVALKLLNPDVAGSREAARRMRDEARILGRLSHRNIVSVLDLVNFGERWGVVMDYVPGADLEEVLVGLDEVDEPFPAPAALEVGSAVCRALHAAYHAGDGRGGSLKVVHRDIKPSNVRLTHDGEVKVLDFGVASVELDTRESATKAKGWIGTERFMAPERILMEGDTLAGDVYAVGASLVELLLKDPLGRTPVLPDRHEPFVEAALTRVRERLSGPDEAQDVVIELLRSLLTADPTQRPAADEAARQLSRAARGLKGEGLSEFAQRFVPGLAAAIEARGEVVEGVLSENTSIQETGAERPLTAEPTYMAPEAPRRKGVWVALAGLAAAGVLIVFALAVVGYLFWPTAPPSPVLVADPVEPTLVPTPVPEVASPEPRDTAAPSEPTQAEPMPVPVELAPQPAEPAPIAPTPAPVVVAPVPQPVAVTEPEPAEPVVRITRALVVMTDASSVEVTCGDRSASGTSSVRIVDFPAGACSVRANYLGRSLTGTVRVDRASTVTCSPTDGGLSCSAS